MSVGAWTGRTWISLVALTGLGCPGPAGTATAEFSVRGSMKWHLKAPATEFCRSVRGTEHWFLAVTRESGRNYLTLESLERLGTPTTYAVSSEVVDSGRVRAVVETSMNGESWPVDSGTVRVHRTAIGDVIDLHLHLRSGTDTSAGATSLRGSVYKLRRTPSWLVRCGPGASS